jgi:hypothetical protein
VEFTIAAGRLLVYWVSTLCICPNVEEEDGPGKFKYYWQYTSNIDGTRCEEHAFVKYLEQFLSKHNFFIFFLRDAYFAYFILLTSSS